MYNFILGLGVMLLFCSLALNYNQSVQLRSCMVIPSAIPAMALGGK